MTLAVILLDEGTSEDAIQQFMERLKPSIGDAIRNLAKSPTGTLADSIAVTREGPRVIRIVSTSDHAKALEEGTYPRVMWNLINRVVPLKLSGTTIFRKVSLNSILKGKWRFPGTAGKLFVERGADLAKKSMDHPIGFRVVKPPMTVIDVG